MSADPDNSLPRVRLPLVKPADEIVPPGRMRVLFGCLGWPSGVLEVASWAKREKLAEPIIVQVRPGNPVDERFVQRLVEFDPHLVGFRLEGGQFDEIERLVRTVRRHSDAEIMLGGPTATSHPFDVLEESGADYVIIGEAEKSFNQFLRLAWQHNSKDRQPEIPGLAYRYGGRAYLNTLPQDGYGRTVLDAERLVCCNRLRCLRCKIRPAVEVELIAANRLEWSFLEHFDQQFDSLYFTGGRGCPGACTFCARLHGNEARAKTAEQLLDEILAADRRVSDGTIKVTRWPLFEHTADPELKEKQVAWAAIYDEDFFLHRRRAIEFFGLWNDSPLKDRYRLSLQTNPASMLAAGGHVHEELLGWIDRLKPMVQLGAESFNPELLRRWHKRHSLAQLETVLRELDGTRQDYTAFQLLSDFDTTPEELVETLRRLILGAHKHRRMRIASSPFTIPLYDSDARKLLEFGGRIPDGQAVHFTDYERPQPGWMDPLAAELADLADAQLQFALNPPHRDAALYRAFEVVLERVRRKGSGTLIDRAERAMEEIKESRFQTVFP
ncbi:MAG TPA: cobalamin-dependent protein [Thermoguttaceae bacterium]|nr:cobalamin-dependent protein [Thermoguttaceae bacterium]